MLKFKNNKIKIKELQRSTMMNYQEEREMQQQPVNLNLHEKDENILQELKQEKEKLK